MKQFVRGFVITAGLVGGLGQQPALASAPAAHGSLNACALLTQSDAKLVAGGAVQSPTHRKTAPFFDHCTYISTSSLTTIGLSVASSKMIADSHTQMKSAQQFFQATTVKSPYTHQTVKGVGGSAVYISQFHQLWVLKGDVVFDLQVLLAKSDRLPQMKKVAAKIVGRL